MNDQKSNFLKKMTFNPIKFFCETWNDHSKREKMETIDLHLKRFLARFCWMIFLKTEINSSNIGYFRLTSRDVSHDPSEAPDIPQKSYYVVNVVPLLVMS